MQVSLECDAVESMYRNPQQWIVARRRFHCCVLFRPITSIQLSRQQPRDQTALVITLWYTRNVLRISRRVLFILQPCWPWKRCHTSLPLSLRPGHGWQGYAEWRFVERVLPSFLFDHYSRLAFQFRCTFRRHWSLNLLLVNRCSYANQLANVGMRK